MKTPEEARAYQADWYIRNRERIRARQAANYLASRSKRLAYGKEYRRKKLAEDPDWFRDRARANYARNPVAHYKRTKRYRDAHRDESNAAVRIRRAANRVQFEEWRRAYIEKNPDRYRAQRVVWQGRRRARALLAGGTHSVEEWLEKIELHAGCCVYCGEHRPLTEDHKVPLSRGGTNDIANIVPACRPCNLRKYDRTAAEFLAPRKVA